jgi:hypothetical protein
MSGFPCEYRGYWVENMGDVYYVEACIADEERMLDVAVEEFIHQKLAEEFGLSPETQFE